MPAGASLGHDHKIGNPKRRNRQLEGYVSRTIRNASILEPLVSILIPAYNAEETIADTIQSAIAQTWQRKQIVVVDDGSRDSTAEVARRFATKVTVVSTENQGGAAARNHALRLSQGDYIQFLDADDLQHRTRSGKDLSPSTGFCGK